VLLVWVYGEHLSYTTTERKTKLKINAVKFVVLEGVVSMSEVSDKEFLTWIAARLINVYNESPNVDFVLRLKEIIEHFPADECLGCRTTQNRSLVYLCSFCSDFGSDEDEYG
jgi:hypothetical protein